MDSFDVVIVGAGHAGAAVAAALRQRKFNGSIAMIGEEPELPYERPPLSKDYLAGAKSFDRLLIRPAAFWTERAITLRLGHRVVGLDAANRTVSIESGDAIGFRTLVWAAGGRARGLSCSGGALSGVHTVRNRADVDRMADELEGTSRVAIIGAGYIGLEAAAVLSKLGKAVTVFEAQDRVLARVAGTALSRFYEREHRARGVDIRLGVVIDCIVEGADGVAVGVRLGDGSVEPAEMIIIGIGIEPNVDVLSQAGAEGSNGVAVDETCATTLPNIYAIGDCALHANPYADGNVVRLESVQNANDQAAIVAKALTGAPERYHSVPWFWSDQYDLKLQTVGISAGHDAEVVRGSPAKRSFSIVYLKNGRVVALDCVNAVRDYVQGRALVERGAMIPAERLADADTPLKELPK